MKMVSERFRVDPKCLSLIHEVARSIQPNDNEMVDWFKEYSAEHAERIAFDLEMLETVARNGEIVVDLASIPLLLMAALQQRKLEVLGVDIEPDRFSESISKLGLKIYKCNIELEPLPFGDESINVIVFNEIFEHLRINPIATFREIRRVLKPGGLLFLSTPNGLSLKSCIRLLTQHRIGPDIFSEYEKLSRLGHMGHVREYCVNEVTDFLRRLDFSIDYVCFRGRYGGGAASICSRGKRIAYEGFFSLIPSLRPYFSVVAHK